MNSLRAKPMEPKTMHCKCSSSYRQNEIFLVMTQAGLWTSHFQGPFSGSWSPRYMNREIKICNLSLFHELKHSRCYFLKFLNRFLIHRTQIFCFNLRGCTKVRLNHLGPLFFQTCRYLKDEDIILFDICAFKCPCRSMREGWRNTAGNEDAVTLDSHRSLVLSFHY